MGTVRIAREPRAGKNSGRRTVGWWASDVASRAECRGARRVGPQAPLGFRNGTWKWQYSMASKQSRCPLPGAHRWSRQTGSTDGARKSAAPRRAARARLRKSSNVCRPGGLLRRKVQEHDIGTFDAQLGGLDERGCPVLLRPGENTWVIVEHLVVQRHSQDFESEAVGMVEQLAPRCNRSRRKGLRRCGDAGRL